MKRFLSAVFMITAVNFFAFTERIRSAEASSTLTEKISGKEVVYDALNAFDNDTETVWVENKKDSGIDERLTVVFYEPIKIDEIQIINGFAHKDYYKKNNRVKTLNIGFLYTDAGYVREYTLKDNCENFQSIYLDETFTVDALVFTIQDVYRGTKYNDTCIDEIRFCHNGHELRIDNVKVLKQEKKDAKANAPKDPSEESAVYKKLIERSKRNYQTKDQKYKGIAFFVPVYPHQIPNRKGYALMIGESSMFGENEIRFHECYFTEIDDYMKSEDEKFWQWTDNPDIKIKDYRYIVDIVYRYCDKRDFKFDSSTNSIITEQGTVCYGPDGFSDGYEYRDYLVYTNGNSIKVNGEEYCLIDPGWLFINVYDGI